MTQVSSTAAVGVEEQPRVVHPRKQRASNIQMPWGRRCWAIRNAMKKRDLVGLITLLCMFFFLTLKLFKAWNPQSCMIGLTGFVRRFYYYRLKLKFISIILFTMAWYGWVPLGYLTELYNFKGSINNPYGMQKKNIYKWHIFYSCLQRDTFSSFLFPYGIF